MIDTIEHYKNENLLEQYVLRPGILKGFNWNVIQIYTKGCLHNPASIMERIKNILEGKDSQPAINFSHILKKQTIKFWQATQKQNNLVINYGGTGTNGQEMTKTFENNDKARFEMEKLVREKLNKRISPSLRIYFSYFFRSILSILGESDSLASIMHSKKRHYILIRPRIEGT